KFSMFMMGHQDAKLNLHGLELTPYALPQQEGQFDLSMIMIKDELFLQAGLLYNSDLFERSTIERMAHNFNHFLENCLIAPDSPVNQLSLIAFDESTKILQTWNTYRTLSSEEDCIHHQIDK